MRLYLFIAFLISTAWIYSSQVADTIVGEETRSSTHGFQLIDNPSDTYSFSSSDPNSQNSFSQILSVVDVYPNLSLGSGGTSGAFNLTIGVTLASKPMQRGRLLSFGVSSIFNGDDLPSNVFDYPCPHNSYALHGKKQKGNELGLLLRSGNFIKDNSNRISVYGVGELSSAEIIVLSQSEATGWYYEQSAKLKFRVSAGLGLGYFPSSGKGLLYLEYNYRRGVGLGFGFII